MKQKHGEKECNMRLTTRRYGCVKTNYANLINTYSKLTNMTSSYSTLGNMMDSYSKLANLIRICSNFKPNIHHLLRLLKCYSNFVNVIRI